MDKAFLSKGANKTAPDGLNIIIDDASHIGIKRRDFGTCCTSLEDQVDVCD